MTAATRIATEVDLDRDGRQTDFLCLPHSVACGAMASPRHRPDRVARREDEVGGYPFYVYAQDEGVFEPLVVLEDEVEAGQTAALIHPVETPWRAPQEARFARAGTVVCARVPGRVERRDCLFHLAVD